MNVKLLQKLARHLIRLIFVLDCFGLFPHQKTKYLNYLKPAHSQHFPAWYVSQLFCCFPYKCLQDFFHFETLESLYLRMMQISVQDQTVVCASVLFFSHCVVYDFVDFGSSVKNVQESANNWLVVGDVGLCLYVNRCFFNYVVNSPCKVRQSLFLMNKLHASLWFQTWAWLNGHTIFFFLQRIQSFPISTF